MPDQGPYRTALEKETPDARLDCIFQTGNREYTPACPMCKKEFIQSSGTSIVLHRNQLTLSIRICPDCRDEWCRCKNCTHSIKVHSVEYKEERPCSKQDDYVNLDSLCSEWKQRYPIDY
jgi:hypothetical protein